MKIAVHNKLVEAAKTRKDGVYSYKGFLYAVKNNGVIAYADYFGNCYSCHGYFNTQIGKCERYDRKKKLMEYLNIQ